MGRDSQTGGWSFTAQVEIIEKLHGITINRNYHGRSCGSGS